MCPRSAGTVGSGCDPSARPIQITSRTARHSLWRFVVHCVQVRQLHSKHRRLQRIEPEVPADALVEILRLGAMVAKQPDLSCASAASFVVIRPPSPNAPRFLLGKNEKQPTVPIVPAWRHLISGANCLRRILDDRQPARSARSP